MAAVFPQARTRVAPATAPTRAVPVLRRLRAVHVRAAPALDGPRMGAVPIIVDPVTVLLPEAYLIGSEALWRNRLRMQRVTGTPGSIGIQYKITGQTITLGRPLQAGDRLWCDGIVGSLTGYAPRMGVTPTWLTPTTFQLPAVPLPGLTRIIIDNLAAARRVSGVPDRGEYAISGDVGTIWRDIGTSSLWADYFVAGTTHTPAVGIPITTQLDPVTLRLPVTPLAGLCALYLSGLAWRRVAVVTETGNVFSIAGDTVTLGHAVDIATTHAAWGDWYT